MDKSITLKKIKIGLNVVIRDELLESVVDSYWDALIEANLITLRGFLWGEKLHELSYKYPSSWWQHFKRDCMPIWFKRRYPVQNKVWTVDIHAIYKDLKAVRPVEWGPHLTIETRDIHEGEYNAISCN